MTATYGNQIVENTATLYGDLSGHNLRAYTYNKATQNIWVTNLYVQCGKAGATNARIGLGLYAVDAGLNPTTLLAGTAYTTVSVTKTGTGDGTWLFAPVAATARIVAGKNYALAAHGVDANILIGMDEQSALGTVDDAQFYNETRATVSLPTSFGTPDTIAVEGHLNVYALGDVNAAPYQPGTNGSTMTPTSGSSVSSTTPTFSVLFKDSNQTLTGGLAGDYLGAYRLVVKDAAGNWIWDSSKRAATGAQQVSGSASLAYPPAGTPGAQTLVNGGSYRYAFMVWDAFDAASVWSADQTFTVASNGSLTWTAPASGKIETTTPGPFQATWAHQSALTAVSAEVQILNAAGTVVRSMGAPVALSPAVAVGGTISVTWTQTGFASLPTSAGYTVNLRATDSASNVTAWATGPLLTVDTPPAVPVALSPATGAVVAPPLLTCQCTDADDTVATGLLVKARLKNATGTVLATKLMGLRPGTDRQFDYQVQAADLVNGFATYTWDAYAYDGAFYSEGTGTTGITAEASAVKSANATFVYQAPPTVAFTAPTNGGTVATDIPIYAWTTSTTQTKFHLTIFRAADLAQVYTTGDTTSSLHSWQQPPGKLKNGVVYQLQIETWDTANLTAASALQFTVQYPTPATLPLSLDLVLRPNDTQPTGVHLAWPASSDPNFQQYLVTRRETVDVDAGGVETTLTQIGAVNATEWVDDTPAAGIAHTYSLIQQTAGGSLHDTLLSSVASTQTVTLAFTQCVIANALDPLLGRVVLEGRNTRTYKRTRGQRLVVPWNRSAPLVFQDATAYETVANEFVLLGGDQAALDAWDTLCALDASIDPVLYRDGRGHAVFGVISNLQLTDDPGGVPRRVQVEVTQTAAGPEQVKPLLPVLPALPAPPLLAPVPGTLATPPTEVIPIQPVFTVSNPNAMAHWTALHLLCVNTSIGGVQHTMSTTEQAAALHVANRFPDVITALGNGGVQILQTVEVVTTPITRQTQIATNTFWATPTDIATILSDNKASRFDDVFVYVAVEGIDALPYQGLSYSAKTGGYHYIPVVNSATWGQDPFYVLAHEWLHEAMYVLKQRGFAVPSDAELNAGGLGTEHRVTPDPYTGDPLALAYLSDVMQGLVIENSTGRQVGGTGAAWRSGGGAGPVAGITLPTGTGGTVTATTTPPPATVGTPPAGGTWTIKTPFNPSNVNGVDYRFLSFPVSLQWVPVGQTNQRPGIPMAPVGSCYHDTGNTTAGENAQSEANWILAGAPGGTDAQVSVHFFVDDTHAIQLIPITEVAWHAGDGGSGVGNRSYVAVEQCVGSTLNQAKVRSNCAELHALLAHHLGNDQHLTAQADYATTPSGHVAIAEHHYFSGKDCPHQIRSLGLWASEVDSINTVMGK